MFDGKIPPILSNYRNVGDVIKTQALLHPRVVASRDCFESYELLCQSACFLLKGEVEDAMNTYYLSAPPVTLNKLIPATK